VTDKSVEKVVPPRRGEVERVGVRYGFVGGGRAGFSSAAETSDGVLERDWGG
jgi:hypothetical protein